MLTITASRGCEGPQPSRSITASKILRPCQPYSAPDSIPMAAAIALDLFFGDPRDWPHITRLTGWLSERYERLLTKRAQRTVALGVVFWCSAVGTLLMSYALAR